ncbi:MAG: hypothetical protein K9H16_09820, partial [Bacteroidales bacterium]|nr:hypothetical protein [Bacteroidales bacterium]
SGLGFTEQNYSYDYFYQQMLTDSSSYWDYYQKEIYQFDTIWYLDLDALLQTGDTIFIPNVDSALTFVTDSIQKFKVDTLFENRNSKYHYSFSFLEVPIIGHYTLINQKFYLQISGGIIPMFMISKTGTITYPETGPVINANQISFDYGFMLSVYGSATFGYMFSKRWSIFAEPYFKRNVFSLIQNDDIHVKTNSWGLKAGLTFRLFLFKSK